MISKRYLGSRRFRFIGLAAVVLLTAPIPAIAAEDQSVWTVAYVDGAARTGEGDGVWWSMRLGEDVPPGNHIVTGADGQVTLVRGGDSIEIAPDSEFSVSKRPEAGQDGIVQTLGRLLFKMESRESRDFTIDTPFLAAAIKGTTFTVTVTSREAVVAVDEGSVEVTGGASGEIALIGAGDRASASRDGGLNAPGKRAGSKGRSKAAKGKGKSGNTGDSDGDSDDDGDGNSGSGDGNGNAGDDGNGNSDDGSSAGAGDSTSSTGGNGVGNGSSRGGNKGKGNNGAAKKI